MSRTHLIIPDQHAHPDHNNDRALWLSKFMADIKPDVVVNLGDAADMPSLSSYDRGTKGFQGRTYKRDVDAHLDFQEKLWSEVKKRKKKLPYRVFTVGNHEQRIEKAVNHQPELEGTYGLHDLDLDRYYDEVIPYNGNTPGIVEIDGVLYAHYFVSGVMGRPIGGEHPAYSLLTKEFVSCTCGHVHTMDYCVRTTADGRKIMGLVAGVYQDYNSGWAGEVEKLWASGVAVKRHVDNGRYDLQWVSMQALRDEYGNR